MENKKSWVIVPSNTEEFDELSLKRKLYRPSWSYLHGKLEGDAGHDLYGFKHCDNPIIEKGIYPCEYNGKACSLYIWLCKEGTTHGLIIYDDDKDHIDYVKKCYDDEVPFL